jgi:lipoyl(octanoyl) transferase
MTPIRAVWLGRAPYAATHALQEAVVAARIQGTIPDTVLLLEHDAVITLGRGARAENVLVDEAARARLGIAYAETGRGGDVTYHGPGQLVAYPIFDLKPDRCDVRKYVRDLGKVMIALAADYGIASGMIEGDPGLIGVWADLDAPRAWNDETTASTLGGLRIGKLGAIGVRLSRWVTMHGFAFNVSTDLAGFASIVPCGLRDRAVTSVAALGGTTKALEDVASDAARHLGERFESKVHVESLASRLGGQGDGWLAAAAAALQVAVLPPSNA